MSYEEVCIVGYGSIGKRHHRILSEVLDDATYHIVDVNTELTIDDVINKDLDILVVCTPSNTHLDVIEKFVNSPGLIFVEKPLDASIEKIESFKDNKLDFLDKIHVGSNLRYTKAYQELKKISESGKIFDVCAVSYLPGWRPGINWLNNYSANKSMGGGVVLDFIHEPDVLSSILGTPLRSMSVEKRIFDNITVDSPDTAFITWEYPDKMVNFKFSYGSLEYQRYVEVIDNENRTFKVEFTKDDITSSYRKQWESILKNGPETTFQHTVDLMNVLLGSSDE